MARTDLSRRLTTTDASFLYFERANQAMHIGSCNIYDGHISRAEVIEVLRGRMHLLPRYRQRAIFPPFAAAHPTWEDDPDFDVANHIEERELPAPADAGVLSRVGGAAYAPPLDRNRPLWKLVLLHGYEGDKTAMVAMVHHAMVDGISGVDLSLVMHDLTQDAPPPEPPATPWQPRPLPDPLTLLQDAVRDQLVSAAERWTAESFRLLRPREAGERARGMLTATTTALPSLMRPAPRAPFNGPISGERQFAWTELSFAEIRFIRSVLGGTVNDVVLTVLAGGLGRYLRAHKIDTTGMELRAMCPVSMRKEDQAGTLGNLVSMLIAPLYVDITGPLERLQAERGAMERLKGQGQAEGLYRMTELADSVPPSFQALAGRFEVPNTLLNTVSTNVPGPQIPLYLKGRRMLSWYPLGPLSSGIGLFNAILTYNQKLTFGATVDPKLMPDVWFYAECLRASFAELLAAAAASSEAEPVETSIPPREQRARPRKKASSAR